MINYFELDEVVDYLMYLMPGSNDSIVQSIN